MTPQFHATIHGKVQGVGFRQNTTQTATHLGLTGWVRNNPDGTVTCVAQGERAQLDKLLAFLHEGPAAAHVTNVAVTWENPTEIFTGFTVRR